MSASNKGSFFTPLALIAVGIFVAIWIFFWPFMLVRDYFLLARGIDDWQMDVVALGILAQAVYFAGFLLMLQKCRNRSGKSKPLRRKVPWILGFLGLCGLMMAIISPPYFDSPEQRVNSFEEFCEAEQRANGEIPDSEKTFACIRRKLDAMWP